MKYILFILLIIISSILNAGTIDPAVDDAKYLHYGSQHECVLPIMGILNDKLNSNFRASCVIIDRFHILTAAHVVENSITQHVLYKNKAHSCAIVAIHIQFNSKKKTGYDIAIARLQTPIDLDFYPKLYKDRDEVGSVCSLAGYGFTGNFKTGFLINNYDNQKRAGSNIIDKVNGDTLEYSISQKNKTSLEFLISPGDSGGGLFIKQKLAGIHSYIYATKNNKANGTYNNAGCSTRISEHIDWIQKTKNTIQDIINNER